MTEHTSYVQGEGYHVYLHCTVCTPAEGWQVDFGFQFTPSVDHLAQEWRGHVHGMKVCEEAIQANCEHLGVQTVSVGNHEFDVCKVCGWTSRYWNSTQETS